MCGGDDLLCYGCIGWHGLSFNLSAYRSVFRVWSAELDPGHTQASIRILTFSEAMKLSLSTIVSLL